MPRRAYLAHCAFSQVLVLGMTLCPSSAIGEPRELRYDLRVDVPVTVVATLGWIGSEVLKGQLARRTCDWCDQNPDGTDAVNGLDAAVRDALKWTDISAGDTASSVAGFALMPIAAFGLTALAASHENRLSNFPADFLLIAEATAIAADLNQIVKFTVGRERPFVHALSSELKDRTSQPSDNNTSFYSGHTNLVFALAVSSGTMASMRGYRWAPWVWAGGLTIAATTGYLRIAGDRHYFTDVLTGAMLGSAVGFAVPYFLHRPLVGHGTSLSAAPLPGGATIAATFTW
jgi:membrane-associated phospholipid phosphatase